MGAAEPWWRLDERGDGACLSLGGLGLPHWVGLEGLGRIRVRVLLELGTGMRMVLVGGAAEIRWRLGEGGGRACLSRVGLSLLGRMVWVGLIRIRVKLGLRFQKLLISSRNFRLAWTWSTASLV